MNKDRKKASQGKQSTSDVTKETGSLVITGVTVIDIHTGLKSVQDIVIKNEKLYSLAHRVPCNYHQMLTLSTAADNMQFPVSVICMCTSPRGRSSKRKSRAYLSPMA